jgi:hypothetical protein
MSIGRLPSFLAWYLIQHYQRVHGIKMYSTCLNESSTGNSPLASTNISSATTDSSMLNIDLALFAAACKEMASSNRSLTSSTAFASTQLIAAANAARAAAAAAQQQQQVLSARHTDDVGSVSSGTSTKATTMPLSIVASSISNASYPSLLQEVAHRSSSFVKLLAEAAKQPSCQTCGKDKTSNETMPLSDGQFLTPKAVDVTASRVSDR